MLLAQAFATLERHGAVSRTRATRRCTNISRRRFERDAARSMSDAGQVGFKQPQAGGPSAGDAGAGFYNSLSVSLRFWAAVIKYRERLEK